MKKLSLLVIGLIMCVIAVSACKKGAKETVVEEKINITEKVEVPAAPATGGITPDGIATALSKPLCNCMVQKCNAKDVMSEDECVGQINASLSEALKTKPVQVSQADLDACLTTIKECNCEVIMGTEAPPACKFLN
jgi:hypothetical protein